MDAMVIEEARYTIIDRDRGFELRQYEPHSVMEAVLESDFDEVGNEGFRHLWGNIYNVRAERA